MGAYTNYLKRKGDCLSLNRKTPILNSSKFDFISKKQKLLLLMNQTPNHRFLSESSVLRFYQYPELKTPFRREVHAPTRSPRFGFSINSRKSWCRDSVKENSGDEMGNAIRSRYTKALSSALKSLRYACGGEAVTEGSDEERRGVVRLKIEEKLKEVIDLDNEDSEGKGNVLEDSSIEEMEIVVEGGEGVSSVSRQKSRESHGVVVNLEREYDRMGMERDSLLWDFSDWELQDDSPGKMAEVSGVPVYKVLHDSTKKIDARLQNLNSEIQLKEKQRQAHQLLQPQKKAEAVKKDGVAEAFTPLTEEEKIEVKRAFSKSSWRKVLVTHQNSNIDITGETLQCLRPGTWLNDEVINVYLELLKEREKREPEKFLKCHFFNTFFYKKLISGRYGYNFQSVRRWTSQKKLGYCLLDCDKIFVPIHKDIHWCLAVINKKDKKFQYLDSLGGIDTQVAKVLARYYVDEVKDKTGEGIDVSSWTKEFVEDLPEQENGFDCGMFMIKYADFYSRGVGLCFNQDHMQYFRLRTANEILKLKAA